MPELLPTVEIGPQSADYSVIWLHGLGADGHDFEPIVPELTLPEDVQIHFVFPHAPQRPVTINNGYVMRAWFDISNVDIDSQQDETGIRESAQQLMALIEREIHNGISSERIILAGFSQGGAIALHTGLRYPKRLAGILALSTFLPLAHTLPDEANNINHDVPIMIAHGSNDPVVPVELGELSRSRLINLGYSVQWHVYPMEHNVIPQEIQDISKWLRDIVQ